MENQSFWELCENFQPEKKQIKQIKNQNLLLKVAFQIWIWTMRMKNQNNLSSILYRQKLMQQDSQKTKSLQ
jgi:hypothetical protein